MADSAVADDVVEAAPRRSRKLILLIAAPVVALVLIGAGLYFTGLLGGLFGGGSSAATAANGKPVKPPAFFDVPELLVNINSGGKRSGFLKLSISLELEDAAAIPQVQAVLPRILDNFQTYMRELRVEDLKGSAGLYRLREELLLRVNAAVAPVKVTDVLFKEMLVQ
ncbi:MAG: flagellar basal body-associated FliL family protein [Alphaproteobacteria bacterium]|nr:flagellar basal body-associated FliL family protein [Alphaproteobacteria bacterium]